MNDSSMENGGTDVSIEVGLSSFDAGFDALETVPTFRHVSLRFKRQSGLREQFTSIIDMIMDLDEDTVADLNLPGEFDLIADVQVDAEVQQFPHTGIKPMEGERIIIRSVAT